MKNVIQSENFFPLLILVVLLVSAAGPHFCNMSGGGIIFSKRSRLIAYH